MPPTNNYSANLFESFADELLSKFHRLEELTGRHGTASGNYHEEIVKSVLKNFLSKRYSVKTGFILKGDGEVSKQIDIMVIDESSPVAYIFQEGDFAVVVPEAVVATVEVKSTLDKTRFTQAIENAVRVKSMYDNPFTITSIIFGYQKGSAAGLNRRSLNNWFREPNVSEVIESPALGPDGIIWLKNKFSLFLYDQASNRIRYGLFYRPWRHESATGWQLSVFLSLIINACEERERRIFKENSHVVNLSPPESYALRLLNTAGAERLEEWYFFGRGEAGDPHVSQN